ncbi:MAG TPA: hypothetical protein VI122_21425 [Thermoleophilaceae bacterium]|jgi:hypothetical protein
MGSPETNDDDRASELNLEAERYRHAAAHALEQLEWIVGYLRKLRKSELASALDHNRREILERIS